MCRVLRVSRSSYYKWLVGVASKRALHNQMLSDKIKKIYTLYKGRYGSPRIAKELESLGIKASKTASGKTDEILDVINLTKL